MGEKTQNIAHLDGVLEDELVDRHRGHAALDIACGQHGTRQVHLCHHPAAKNIAVLVAVSGHGNDLQHQLFVGWQRHSVGILRGRHRHNRSITFWHCATCVITPILLSPPRLGSPLNNAQTAKL